MTPGSSHSLRPIVHPAWRSTLSGTAARVMGAVLAPSEKGAKLAQKLGQLQTLLAGFPQECMGQLATFGPTERLCSLQ
jgi:hypothetical protein